MAKRFRRFLRSSRPAHSEGLSAAGYRVRNGAGMVISIGARRPANRGDCGRFMVVSLEHAAQPEPIAA